MSERRNRRRVTSTEIIRLPLEAGDE